MKIFLIGFCVFSVLAICGKLINDWEDKHFPN